jgi:hypothetical protein
MEYIVRGYIIPYIKDNKVIYSEVIDQQMRKEILEKFIEIINIVKKDFGKNTLSTIRDLNHFLNLLTIYLKNILYIDPIKDIIIAPISGLYEHYKNDHITIKDFTCKKPLFTSKGLLSYIEYLTTEDTSKKWKLIKKPTIKDIDLILKMPADTRIGLNTSSLLIHSLTTSAIASALYLSKYNDEYGLTITRLLSLFHDIGKLESWINHEKKSIEIIKEKIFAEYIQENSEAWKIINETCKILEMNEKERVNIEYYKIFRDADTIASEIDRVKEIIPIVLSKEISEKLLNKINTFLRKMNKEAINNLKDAYEAIFNNWNFWNEYLSLDERIEFTEDFCKNVSVISSENKVYDMLLSESKLKTSDIVIVRFDFSSIQSYIWSNDIRTLMGGSRIVDIVVYASIPDLLINLGIPYECILTFGGGNLTAIIPANKIDDVKEMLNLKQPSKQLNKLDILGVRINIGESPIYDNYLYMNKIIEKNILKSKVFLSEALNPDVKLDIYRKCDICGSDIAKFNEKFKDKKLCEKCQIKYNVGEKEHFIYKIQSFHKWIFDKAKKYIELFSKGDILVYIAGHSIEESKKTIEKYKSISMVRFDGNVIGQFMASSISITDSFERSIRIDRAVKDAINDFYNILKDISEEDALRFVLGLMYVGGDDGTLIMPAWLSIPFSIYLLNRYFYSLGGKSTLSIAIIGSKPKHPIIPLYEATGHLLDEYAKKNGGRDLCYNNCHSRIVDKVSNDFRGAIAFYNIDTGKLSLEYLDEILKTLYNEKVSMIGQYTYTLSSLNNQYSIFKLLKIIFDQYDKGAFSNINIDTFNEEFLKKYLNIYVNEKTNFIEHLKKIKRAINSILSINIGGFGDINLRIVYSASQYKNDNVVENYGVNSKLLLENLLIASEKGIESFNLIDLQNLMKLLGGGEYGV